MRFTKSIVFILWILIIIGCHKNHYNGAVVSGHPEATKIGIKVLEQGGNAIDASIAVQLALAVCLPSAGNIGGGGFMIYRNHQGENYALDFRESAPQKAHGNMYLDDDQEVIDSLSTYGPLSVGVPGTIDGIFVAHERFGSIDIQKLFNYAIDLARMGFPLTKEQAKRLNYYKQDFIKYNHSNNYLQSDKWSAGDTLQQLDLAHTLTLIRDQGKEVFYEGEIAESIVSSMGKQGVITTDDLKNYQSIWRQPINFNFGSYKLISMPPPSSGGIALSQLLMTLSNFQLDDIQHNSKEYIHLLSEIEKLVYADRATHLGDIDYYNVPINDLMNFKYNKGRSKLINKLHATPSDSIYSGYFNDKESEETTHFSIVDNYGNSASVTTTLNTNYGSKLFVQSRGFLLNNEMDDFSAKPGYPNTYGLIGSKANSIEPGKRMLSSMSPTIVEKNKKLFLVLGSPGGSTIITSVFQTILNSVLFDMDIKSAVNAPRFHHQWKPDKIYMEDELYSDSLKNVLWNIGHQVTKRKSIGHVNAIMIEENNLSIAADKRGDNSGQITSE